MQLGQTDSFNNVQQEIMIPQWRSVSDHSEVLHLKENNCKNKLPDVDVG